MPTPPVKRTSPRSVQTNCRLNEEGKPVCKKPDEGFGLPNFTDMSDAAKFLMIAVMGLGGAALVGGGLFILEHKLRKRVDREQTGRANAPADSPAAAVPPQPDPAKQVDKRSVFSFSDVSASPLDKADSPAPMNPPSPAQSPAEGEPVDITNDATLVNEPSLTCDPAQHEDRVQKMERMIEARLYARQGISDYSGRQHVLRMRAERYLKMWDPTGEKNGFPPDSWVESTVGKEWIDIQTISVQMRVVDRFARYEQALQKSDKVYERWMGLSAGTREALFRETPGSIESSKVHVKSEQGNAVPGKWLSCALRDDGGRSVTKLEDEAARYVIKISNTETGNLRLSVERNWDGHLKLSDQSSKMLKNAPFISNLSQETRKIVIEAIVDEALEKAEASATRGRVEVTISLREATDLIRARGFVVEEEAPKIAALPLPVPPPMRAGASGAGSAEDLRKTTVFKQRAVNDVTQGSRDPRGVAPTMVDGRAITRISPTLIDGDPDPRGNAKTLVDDMAITRMGDLREGIGKARSMPAEAGRKR